MKECAASKCQSWVCLQITQLQCPMGCHGHHVSLCSQTGLFLETISLWHLVVPLNNFAFMSSCPWVHGRSNKPLSLPRCMCVCVCVGGGGANSYSMILPQFLVSLILMNMQMR